MTNLIAIKENFKELKQQRNVVINLRKSIVKHLNDSAKNEKNTKQN